MFKVIYNDLIIDVLDKVTYLKYLPKVNRLTKTDRTSANCIYGSDNKTVYILQGVSCPEGKNWKKVRLEYINDTEYKKLNKLVRTTKIYSNPTALAKVREDKILELKQACSDAIVSGVSVLFSDNLYHHFKLTIEDQINLQDIESQIKEGAKTVVYHETNMLCKVYSSAEIAKLIDTAKKHKQYHTTYFNILKHFINTCIEPEKISALVYGVDLETLCLDKELLEVVRKIN